jgi:hypothetical protein
MIQTGDAADVLVQAEQEEYVQLPAIITLLEEGSVGILRRATAVATRIRILRRPAAAAVGVSDMAHTHTSAIQPKI